MSRAQAILDAFGSGRLIGLLTDDDPALDEDGAYAIACEVHGPLLAFAYLAEMLSEQSRFEPVQAGEIVTTGTLTPALPIALGETWSTTLDGIELPGLSLALV